MSENAEKLYTECLNRYVTAMQNEKPDQIPIRPFVAEFVAKYVGYNNQEVTHDYELIFEATRKCAIPRNALSEIVGTMLSLSVPY